MGLIWGGLPQNVKYPVLNGTHPIDQHGVFILGSVSMKQLQLFEGTKWGGGEGEG